MVAAQKLRCSFLQPCKSQPNPTRLLGKRSSTGPDRDWCCTLRPSFHMKCFSRTRAIFIGSVLKKMLQAHMKKLGWFEVHWFHSAQKIILSVPGLKKSGGSVMSLAHWRTWLSFLPPMALANYPWKLCNKLRHCMYTTERITTVPGLEFSKVFVLPIFYMYRCCNSKHTIVDLNQA